MKKRQSSIRNMYQVVINILELFSTTWAGFAAFVLAVTNYKESVTDLDETAVKQQASLSGYTVNKKNKKRDMANKSLVTRGKVNSFAFATGDTILQGKMKIAFDKLYYKKDTTAIANAELIYSAASAMTPAERTEYDITDTEMDDLRAAIDAFINLPSPRQMKVIRKQLTAELKTQFEDSTEMLRDNLDGLMHEYKQSDPDFYDQYFNARRLVVSTLHTTIEGNVTDNIGVDLKKVQVTLTGKNKETQVVEATFEEMTDLDGNFKKGELNPELEWKAKFVLPEYEIVTVGDLEIKPGEHINLEIKMNKIVP